VHRSNHVVPEVKPVTEQFCRPQPLTEEQFGATLRIMLNRMIRQHGEATVAMWLGVSVRHLGTNVLRGSSLPSADKIWNLLAYDASAHDELDSEYGLKNVHQDAFCSSDPLTRDMIALAHETAEDEAPDSPGGLRLTDQELLHKDEARLRRVYQRLGTWLDRIQQLRRPNVRSIRA
jgi:hypothetical protein